jgi:hypothetical protein
MMVNSKDDLNEAHYTWPTPEQARDYRNKVRVAVDGLIQTLPISLPISVSPVIISRARSLAVLIHLIFMIS